MSYTMLYEKFSVVVYDQLTSRDTQDTYMTDDAYKYFMYLANYPSKYYSIYPLFGSYRLKKSQKPIYIGQYPYYNSAFNI
jgi:hypothetical protein